MDETIEEHKKTKFKKLTLEDENGNTFKVCDYDGIIFPPTLFKTEAEILKRFSYVEQLPYKAGDVLLCSFPKTGTHWVTNILHYLMYDGDLDDMVSYPPCYIDFFDVEAEVQRNGTRLQHSHFPPKRLPVEHIANHGKTILLFRNPKDTVVSTFYMMKNLKKIDFRLAWESTLKFWLEGKILLGSYLEYYNSWQKELNQHPSLDILLVQYENLKLDSLNEVRRIQKYLGLNHPDERLEAVLNKCSLENLRADVESGKVKARAIDDEGKSAIYRKGIIGDWKNLFTVAQNEMFENIINEKLKTTVFDYKSWN